MSIANRPAVAQRALDGVAEPGYPSAMDSLQGKLLVASPVLDDPNFVRTITLMVRHDEDGALGLVVNRPTRTSLSDVWERIADTPCNQSPLLHDGGPCEGPLMLLHRGEGHADHEILPGIYFTADRDNVGPLVAGDDAIKPFVGYAGWTGGQLEGELETGSWLIVDARADLVFDADATTWGRLAERLAPGLLYPDVPDGLFPSDPSLN